MIHETVNHGSIPPRTMLGSHGLQEQSEARKEKARLAKEKKLQKLSSYDVAAHELVLQGMAKITGYQWISMVWLINGLQLY